MKKLFSITICALLSFGAFAQFGTFKKREDIEKFKDTRLIIVLLQDSAYNASVIAAVERYWTYTGYDFAEDTALYRYKKGDYAFLYFSKSKGSKIKAKVASSEEDMNAFVITKKFSRRITPDILLAYAYSSNRIDTPDWNAEATRGIQMLNNYFNYAIQAGSDGEIAASKMMNNYPSDKSQLVDKKLLIEDKQLDLKGKEDAMTIFDGDAEEVDIEEIQKAIIWQDNSMVYFFYSKDEKFCNKLFVSAANSELLYYTSDSPEKCKCNAKDLKALKDIKTKAVGGN